jgi:spore coat polysaccharide biosynthesis predicted glycosyltransferase SpsG
MRIILRADASLSNGTGHVMRSLAILEEFKARKLELVFIGKIQDTKWLTTKIVDFGFTEILESENDFTPNPKSDILILDSYTIPADSPFIVSRYWKKIIVLCDELTPNYQADLYIHPGLEANWFKFPKRRILFGPNYIPLRKTISKNMKLGPSLKVVIVGGGTNPEYFVENVAEILSRSSAEFDAVCFTTNQPRVRLDSRFTRLPIGADLDFYANDADLAFTTASTTGLEFIAREIACGVACVVDNQRQYYKVLVENEVVYPIGTFKDSSWELDEPTILRLLESQELRQSLRDRCKNYIDLKGTTRIADEILEN